MLDDPCSMASSLVAGTAYPVTMLALTSCTLVTGVFLILYLVFRQWRSNRLFGRSWSRQTVNVFSPTATGNKVRIPSDFSTTRKLLVSRLHVRLADFLNSGLASQFPRIRFLTPTPRSSINRVQPLPSTIYPRSPIYRSSESQSLHGYSLPAPHTPHQGVFPCQKARHGVSPDPYPLCAPNPRRLRRALAPHLPPRERPVACDGDQQVNPQGPGCLLLSILERCFPCNQHVYSGWCSASTLTPQINLYEMLYVLLNLQSLSCTQT